MLTQKRLKRLLSYDPKTGEWRWRVRVSNKCRAGMKAGYLNNEGYRMIEFAGKAYSAHRLAFLYMTGVMPKAQVDHKNRVRDDNRWRNLREATHAQNCANAGLQKDNKTGFRGVYKFGGKYRALATINGKQTHLGMFDTAEEAGAVTLAARKEQYGSFAN